MDNDRPELIRQGIEAFEKQNWKEAVYFFGQALIIENTFDINKRVVESLVKIGKYDEAIEQASVYYERYLREAEDARFLFNILIETDEIMVAYQFLEIIKDVNYTVLDDEDVQQIQTALAAEELDYSQDFADELEIQEKELLSLVTMPAGVQASKIRNMRYLPMNDFLSISENLLLNPYLHPLFKNEIIENLVKLKIDKKYAISFFGELREFNPADITTLLYSPEYLKAKEELQSKLVNRDDYEASMMISEFLLYISMSYPFMDKIVTNIDSWTDVYINRFDKKSNDSIKNSEEIAMWLDRYNKLLETFEN